MHATAAPQTIVELLAAQKALGMWYGIVAPSGIPPAVRASLVDAVDRARRTPEMVQRIDSLGFLPIVDDPTQFGALMRSEIDKYTVIARKGRMAAGGNSRAATH